MSKSFRIIISGFSLLFTVGYFFVIPLLLADFVVPNFPNYLNWLETFLNSLDILVVLLYPFWVLLGLFFGYCFYKIIKGDTKFFFIFLNSFGALGFIVFIIVYFSLLFA